MARGKPVILRSCCFPRQKDAEEFFRIILHRAPLKSPLPVEDEAIVLELLERHPEYSMKEGCGIQYIEVRINQEPGHRPTRGFHIVRTDGSSIDFSFKVCISQRGKNLLEQVRCACRQAIMPALQEAKQQAFESHANDQWQAPCSITGEYLPWEQLEIDHAAPATFGVIFNGWLTAMRMDGKEPSADWITDPADKGIVSRFVIEEIEAHWIRYHNLTVTSAQSLRLVKAGLHRRFKAQRVPKIQRPLLLPA